MGVPQAGDAVSAQKGVHSGPRRSAALTSPTDWECEHQLGLLGARGQAASGLGFCLGCRWPCPGSSPPAVLQAPGERASSSERASVDTNPAAPGSPPQPHSTFWGTQPPRVAALGIRAPIVTLGGHKHSVIATLLAGRGNVGMDGFAGYGGLPRARGPPQRPGPWIEGQRQRIRDSHTGGAGVPVGAGLCA